MDNSSDMGSDHYIYSPEGGGSYYPDRLKGINNGKTRQSESESEKPLTLEEMLSATKVEWSQTEDQRITLIMRFLNSLYGSICSSNGNGSETVVGNRLSSVEALDKLGKDLESFLTRYLEKIVNDDEHQVLSPIIIGLDIFLHDLYSFCEEQDIETVNMDGDLLTDAGRDAMVALLIEDIKLRGDLLAYGNELFLKEEETDRSSIFPDIDEWFFEYAKWSHYAISVLQMGYLQYCGLECNFGDLVLLGGNDMYPATIQKTTEFKTLNLPGDESFENLWNALSVEDQQKVEDYCMDDSGDPSFCYFFVSDFGTYPDENDPNFPDGIFRPFKVQDSSGVEPNRNRKIYTLVAGDNPKTWADVCSFFNDGSFENDLYNDASLQMGGSLAKYQIIAVSKRIEKIDCKLGKNTITSYVAVTYRAYQPDIC